METPVLLDVRVLEPRLKHPTIFSTFDALAEGESFLLINDHDPLPLQYQFKAERPGSFRWEYVAQGPEVWQVRLTKIPGVVETVADLVRTNPAAATVFKKLNIDFCCKGGRPFADACAEAGLNPDAVKKELQTTTLSSGIPDKANVWPLDFLADYIVQNHHRYVAESVPAITALLNKVVAAHGQQHPELETVQAAFALVANDLTAHMLKEERILFPAIRQVTQLQKTEHPALFSFPFGSIANPIRMMEVEHVDAGDTLESIRSLTNNFTVPADGCYSFQLLYQQLEAFETDLHQHVHLENNILFPKAIQAERELQLAVA
ncbi:MULTISPECIES: iron-sulfur cluster repair di-iron protein [unclassified Spirosoma]|uniref:iron-sulfur cluster repair di-iron protein n=1 Tax=unclassified Spirosoma TaxID=2621999 RepID=UPI000960D2D9|nr:MULTISPECIES: iron-sulfur cluster repair di-iron protein [unclassified Spirosoma]MBN8820433.1 iron-sulfur cluster repair di-iron protein [Spirosoma sp.]OJW70015.1 MAG: iron-sulfur cluster repair di-iron protein [Spirosoma sp. 48-14]